MSRYFNLAPECYLIIGEARSAVYNLNTGAIIALDEEQTRAMTLAESKKPIEDDVAVYDYLANRGWGFYSSRPVFVDKARPLNVFGERRIWQQQMQFIMAGLQVTARCNKTCSDCGKTFCPACFSGRQEENCKELTVEQWQTVIDELAIAGCRSVMFTGGECLLYDGLPRLIKYVRSTGMEVVIQTNGEVMPEGVPEDVDISVFVNRSSNIELIMENLKGRKKVSIIAQDVDEKSLIARVPKEWRVRGTCSSEPIKGKLHLSNAKIDDFFNRRMKDPCLNGKMYILCDGSVVPCLQGRKSILGNALTDDFSIVFKKLTLDYWCAEIGRRLTGKKCGNCEFRYGCSVCRFSDVEDSCFYDQH